VRALNSLTARQGVVESFTKTVTFRPLDDNADVRPFVAAGFGDDGLFALARRAGRGTYWHTPWVSAKLLT